VGRCKELFSRIQLRLCFRGIWSTTEKVHFEDQEQTFLGERQNRTLSWQHVLSRLSLDADDTLAYVGCGEGMLLRLAPCREKIGFTATQEEAMCLSNESFPVRQSFVEKIALPSEFADITVCHDVLSLVSRNKIPIVSPI